MSTILEEIKVRIDKLEKERETLESSLHFFRQNYENAREKIIAIIGKIQELKSFLKEEDKEEEVIERDKEI